MKKVFVSFDYDNDSGIKSFLTGQSKNPDSPFVCADWSLKEAAPQNSWVTYAEQKIKQCDILIVMIGRNTHKAQGVLKEVDLARRYNIPVVQIIAYKDLVNPVPVPNAGTLYRWNWDNLRKILA